MSEDPIDPALIFKRELEELRTMPKFRRTVLRELREQFIEEMSQMGEATAADAEKHRGVVVFIANFYETLAGEPIVGSD